MFNNEFCYLEVTTTGNWYEAQADCVARGSHLISVHSEEEQQFLESKYIAKLNCAISDGDRQNIDDSVFSAESSLTCRMH